MIDIPKCYEAMQKLIDGDYSLHVPAMEDDPDVIIDAALAELDRLQKHLEFWSEK